MRADNRIIVAIFNAAAGISLGFMVAAAWYGDISALAVFAPLAWLSTAAWLTIENQIEEQEALVAAQERAL